jgi:hypothetical protein
VRRLTSYKNGAGRGNRTPTGLLAPADFKFPTNEKSITCTDSDQLLPIALNAVSGKALGGTRRNSSQLVGFGGRHKNGHSFFACLSVDKALAGHCQEVIVEFSYSRQ